ncbi:MAG: ATP-dependent helicase, partial [Candidatus Rokuibacteriota bacterium]
MRVAILPSGALFADAASSDDEASDGLSAAARVRVARAFARGPGHALLDLGATELDAPLSPPLTFLRDLGRAFVTRLCAVPDLEERRERAEVDCPPDERARLAGAVPPMDGGEYVDAEWVAARWADLNRAFAEEIRAHRGSVGNWLSARHPSWHAVGKVCLHLAENRGDEEHPFAFLATYAARASAGGKVRHRPLARALEESSARGDRQALLHLLVPLQRAAEQTKWLAELIDSGAIYEAMAWTPAEAHRFLRAIPAFEAAGLVVRVPDWWRPRRPPRPEVTVRVGEKKPSALGMDALLDFSVAVALGDEKLTAAEVRQLLASSELRGSLRPYQKVGVSWLAFASSLRLGVCLADDMGLGKTIQVLGLLLLHKRRGRGGDPPHLLVAPASLLANWQAEIERFAPSLATLVAHPSAMPARELAQLAGADLGSTDLVITTYGTLARVEPLRARQWSLAILDEAQAIKNPGARQTQAVKALKAHARIALTGTPVENRLGDLWSIYDFLDPGLLGSAREFSAFAKGLADRTDDSYAPLRRLIQPYLLRRLKTDRAIVADLPDKTEVKAFCLLSSAQAALYQKTVDELERAIAGLTQGIERRGLVLAYLMRFKQICNHPAHWLGEGAWDEAGSGKLARLREIVDAVAAKQEKVLVFTQFREATEPLAAFLTGLFGRPGLVLHGSTPVRARGGLVRRFQEDATVPFFVLSVKAGGTGLNLTAASHVVHFDRWWNPAVEDQATDRAYRIGQHKNVLVHKLVCRGTVEERIDRLIE